ncbi:MAG: PD40 domain-containing protein [Muribaculaceae bacterium]|nr:PD40 domain-containing protein [Muribaculaceae bacterium]
MNKKILIAVLAVDGILNASAITPLWMRDVRISPDGSEIAFCYKGDIWKVPVKGGQASRLTTTPSYESEPVWSPDGRQIAFASDRHGNFDIYVMDANGGPATRLTTNSAIETPQAFTPDGKDIVFSAAIQAPAKSAMFPSARMTQVYTVPVKGGSSKQIMGTPAQRINFIDNNGSFLYQDIKGFEDEWRKHHTSSVTRDIWRYDAKSRQHTNLTNRGGEDRDPNLIGDQLYFLSERGGKGATINVYSAPISDLSAARAVTSFKTHPVRFLSSAKNGLLCMTYNGEIYTMAPGATPAKVNIEVIDDIYEPIDKISVSSPRGSVPSPDGKYVAFISRGDIFVTSVEYKTTKQITNTPQAETAVVWSPDGKKLVYGSERDGRINLYEATIDRDELEPDWANATLINEKPLFKADSHERNAPDFSPDGKKLAFIQDRQKLMVMDLKSHKVTQLTDGRTNPERNGTFNYQWSPDSKWIVMEGVDRKHEPYFDIMLVNAETGDMTNLTNSGYFDESPRWALDGNAIIFASERYGMRNHASWGSMSDVMMIFLNQDAYDKYKLSAEDYAIKKQLDKNAKGKGKDSKEDNDSQEDKANDKDKTIEVQLEGIEDRVVRLTPMSTNLSDAITTADGENLYYLITAPDGKQLWKLNLRKGDHKMVSKVTGASSLASNKDGKTLFIFGSQMRKLDPKSEKLTPITYSAKMNINHAAEREAMFDNMVREERERFYTKDMHGVNWDAMTKDYRRFLPHITNNHDYAEMLSELLGELNVSHTGGRYNPTSSNNDDRTASLGLLYDLTYNGDGLKVAEVLKKGPFDRGDSNVVPGCIITAINGNPLTDLAEAMLDLAGKKTLVSIKASDGTKFDEVVLPIAMSKHNTLMYNRWVKQRAADVDRLSGGRLGYVHIQSMADDSFRKMYADALGKYNDREGLVIDIRWNGGGRLHEDIEVFLTGRKYLTQEIRGVETCDMPSRRWNKPSIMVMAEACYSNAHGTPWVYKHQGIGKLVGMPVPGTMTSVNWVTMQDPSLVYGIPVIGYRLADGSVLENQQLEPDIKVSNDPEKIVLGEDQQLATAVKALLDQIDNKK